MEGAKTSHFLLLVLLISVQVALLIHSSTKLSPTFDEGGHLLAGLYLGEKNETSYYTNNPPFIKLLAFLAVKMAGLEFALPLLESRPVSWVPDFLSFMRVNGMKIVEGLFWARLVIIVFFAIGAIVIWLWALELYGIEAAYIASFLWIFNPIVLGYSNLFTMDVPAATLSFLGAYLFHGYTVAPSFKRLVLFAAAFGLAIVTKFSALVFAPVMLVYGISRFLKRRDISLGIALAHGLVIVTIVVLIINTAYFFQGTPTHLGILTFHSTILSAVKTKFDLTLTYITEGNRFREHWLGHIPLPLPRDFVSGIDDQLSQENAGQAAYMRGMWKDGGGWYHYYLYACLVKMPVYLLEALLLFLVYSLLNIRSFYRVRPVEWFIWGAALFYFAIFSFNTGINSHVRYILPSLPFLFLGVSSFGKVFSDHLRQRVPRKVFSAVCVVLFLVVAFPPLSVHPHYISFFNSISGGTRQGWRNLVDSNLDWGQDLGYLKEWLDQHKEVESIGLAYFGLFDPQIYGINFTVAPPLLGSVGNAARIVPQRNETGLREGWFAISANFLAGMEVRIVDENGEWVPMPRYRYSYFQSLKPVDIVGSSIFIFHLTRADVEGLKEKVNRSRRRYIYRESADD